MLKVHCYPLRKNMRVLTFLLMLPVVAFANGEPLVSQFFGQNGIANKNEVYIGEMLTQYLDKPTLGERLPKDTEISQRILEKTPNREIYAVSLSKNGISRDWYIYLVNDQIKWKISALRSLALPGLFFMTLQELESKTNRTSEEEYEYQNMLLTMKPDAKLKEFLLEHIDDFNSIASKAAENTTEANEIAKRLNLNTVQIETGSGMVDVSIGGILDNSVGYLSVPNISAVPRMTDDDYIYIENVVGNWYLYKKT